MITKTLIKEKDRLDFLPTHIGKNYLKYEFIIFRFMDMFCEDYSGGYWDYFNLDNGGMFISLNGEINLKVCNPNNYFDDQMSAEAVSIGVNLYALNTLVNTPDPEQLINLYYALRDFACEHREANKILKFID
ncbi:MAG: antirestriction protein [Candidatus Thiodiazotropha sp. (ex Lucinoma kastoroae)]|nr:antirestriction protein [Candidatus Thiodiazotropha sp. (ex Lucinoma kastoroae)]